MIYFKHALYRHFLFGNQEHQIGVGGMCAGVNGKMVEMMPQLKV